MTVRSYEPIAGTEKLLGTEIRVSPVVIVPASKALDTVLLKVLGVNFDVLTLKLWLLPVGLKTVRTKEVGEMVGTCPKLAETGRSQVFASAATERSSRPAPCAVGPRSCVPVLESLTTKSARLTSADLTWSGDHSG